MAQYQAKAGDRFDLTPSKKAIAAAAELDRFDDTTLGFARTQLVRGQNRLISALRQAQRHIALVAG